MDEQRKATILVGASEVAGDRRHLYLLFQKSDGSQTVVRGGPDTRAEGNDLANFAESTVLGSEKFGHIRVETAPYIAPYEIGYRLKQDGNYEPVPLNQLDPSEPALARDAKGNIVKATVTAPDWPAPGERHERIVAWSGSDQELSDVPPILSSTSVWSPIPYPKEIGREEAFFRRTDHRLPARSRSGH
ncbi:hypothetical protein WH216_15990, partial [Xanthomonas perforans]